MQQWYYTSGKKTYKDMEKTRARDRARYANDPEFRKKKQARTLARQEVRRGRIDIEPCTLCGEGGDNVIHHNDYNLPRDITWLCPPCHNAIHATLPTF